MGVVPAPGMERHAGTQIGQGNGSAGDEVSPASWCDATPHGTLQGHLCHQGTSSLPHGVVPMSSGPCVSTWSRVFGKGGTWPVAPIWLPPWVPHVPKSLMSPNLHCTSMSTTSLSHPLLSLHPQYPQCSQTTSATNHTPKAPLHPGATHTPGPQPLQASSLIRPR